MSTVDDLPTTAAVTGSPPLPEPGQVVSVRGSTWAVSDVRVQGLPRSPADEAEARLTHVVSLQSLDEDRLGEELDVVWELEVGHTVAPDQGLPELVSPSDFDDPNLLAAFVDAVRWGAVTSADENAYQSPFRSGANIEAYQLEPLRRALQSSRTNLLLADDVGLGKTIEAGLVVQELLLRHRARSVVVVCPPSLSLKWQDEMREKFGLEFVIVNSDLMAQVRRSHGLAANPFRLFPRVILSMSWLPTPRAQRLLRQVYAEARSARSARRFAFDVLVVDEAHHVAPANPTAGIRGYAVDSKRTVATRDLAERCEHRLFLSATPHNGYPESFTALMEMIDDRRFTRGARLDEAALKAVTVRRLKTALPDKDFKQRELKVIPFTPSDDEEARFDLLDRILRASAERNRRPSGGGIVGMLLKKRFLSSPWSFGCTLDLYRGAATGRALRQDDAADLYLDLVGSSQDDQEEGEADQPEFEALRGSKGSDPLVAATPAELDSLVAWGLSHEHRADSRLDALVTFLDGVCRPDGRTWSNERVVVFTEYAATLAWVVDVLRQRGYAGVLSVIQGSTPTEDREDIRARFSEDPAREPVRVLVATDSAGEGIDLQAYCHRLVNYDVPFNPSRLEQRIGRIDRYGQAYPPEVHQLSPVSHSSTYAADLDFLRRIAEKVGNVAHDLGSVNQVIDAEIQERFAPTTRPAKRQRRAPEDGNAQINKALAGELELNRRLTELARNYEQRKSELHLLPGNARRVVDTALTLTAQPPLVESGHERTDAAVFEVPGSLSPAWEQALHVGRVDTRLSPGVWRPVTFDDRAARDCAGEVAHVHLGHPLLQRAARILRSKLFGVGSEVHRVTAVVVDGLPESCVAAVSRLVLVGRGGLRLHEQVFLTGIRVHGQELAEEKVEAVLDSSLDATSMALAGEELRAGLATAWNAEGSRMRARLARGMEHRAERLQQQVAARLQHRREADVTRAREIFAAFRRNLLDSQARLAAEIAGQEEMLFTDDQQVQRRRDLRTMEDRMASLDEELAREIAAIEERYADVRAHVSAAAVVFALTPEDALSGRVS